MPDKNALEFSFDAGSSALRLDRLLADRVPSHSRSFLQKRIREGCVKIDGKTCDSPKRLLSGSGVVSVEFPEVPDAVPRPEPFGYPILYEDDAMLVIDKPPGAVVHPGAGNAAGTIVNALLGRYPDMAARFGNADARPGIVHRLDKDTSGVLVIAKTPEAQFKLGKSFAERKTVKTYLALVRGVPEEADGEISTRIGRNPVNRQKMAVVERNGKTAITHYSVEKSGGIDGTPVSLLKVSIATGRTHQIRVHMAYIGHPVIGDAVYGGSKNRPGNAARQMLHAWKLAIPHPVSGEMKKFVAPVPPDMAELLALL